MKVGFTGTRDGMTEAQLKHFGHFIFTAKLLRELHHGCCVGADAQAHDCILHGTLDVDTAIHAHPPIKTEYKATLPLRRGTDTLYPPKDYLERDRDIVDATDRLVATPKGPKPNGVRFGGTWYTINYAIRQGKPVMIIFPDGKVEIH